MSSSTRSRLAFPRQPARHARRGPSIPNQTTNSSRSSLYTGVHSTARFPLLPPYHLYRRSRTRHRKSRLDKHRLRSPIPLRFPLSCINSPLLPDAVGPCRRRSRKLQPFLRLAIASLVLSLRTRLRPFQSTARPALLAFTITCTTTHASDRTEQDARGGRTAASLGRR